MKFINPSVEIWEQDVTNPDTLIEAMWAHIARCVRVCYQVNKPKNNETEEEYVRRVIFRNPEERLANHYSVLEHGAIYLTIPEYKAKDDNRISHIIGILGEDPYTKTRYARDYRDWRFSTNLRVLVEHNILDALKYAVPFNPKWHTRRVTVSFITNIGVAREFNRHRTHSISEESTRYCNYSKDRFNNELTFIKPTWISKIPYTENKNPSNADQFWVDLLLAANTSYTNLIDEGWTPQQAREILPLATKVQTIHTAFVDDWKEFFALRADGVSGPPHPNAEVLAKVLKEEFINRKYI